LLEQAVRFYRNPPRKFWWGVADALAETDFPGKVATALVGFGGCAFTVATFPVARDRFKNT